MECKEYMDVTSKNYDAGIDLTRMECKVQFLLFVSESFSV